MKRLLLLVFPLSAFAAAPTTDWSPNLTATAAWIGNVSNGEAVWDRIATLQLGADVVASSRYDMSPTDAAHFTLHFAGNWFPRYLSLDDGALGARLDWQHTFGHNEFAPVFTVEAAGDGVKVVESARSGIDGALTLKLGKRFGERWRAEVRERLDRYDGNSSVFDNRSHETALEISRDFNNATRIVLTGRWRDGDIVTYAQFHRPDLLAIADDNVSLKTFHMPMTAYSIHNAQSVSAKLAVVHAVSDEAAVIFAYEYGNTRHTGLKFENQIISASLVRQF